MDIKLAMARELARAILAKPRKYSPAVRSAAADFTASHTIAHWDKPENTERWEASSNSWKRLKPYLPEILSKINSEEL